MRIAFLAGSLITLLGGSALAGPVSTAPQPYLNAPKVSPITGLAWPALGSSGRDWLLRQLMPKYSREEVIGYFGPGDGQKLPGGIVAGYSLQPSVSGDSMAQGKGYTLVIELSGALSSSPMVAECMTAPKELGVMWNWTGQTFAGQALVQTQVGTARTVAGFAPVHQVIKPVVQGVDKLRFTLAVRQSGMVKVPQCRLTRPLPPQPLPQGVKIGGR